MSWNAHHVSPRAVERFSLILLQYHVHYPPTAAMEKSSPFCLTRREGETKCVVAFAAVQMQLARYLASQTALLPHCSSTIFVSGIQEIESFSVVAIALHPLHFAEPAIWQARTRKADWPVAVLVRLAVAHESHVLLVPHRMNEVLASGLMVVEESLDANLGSEGRTVGKAFEQKSLSIVPPVCAFVLLVSLSLHFVWVYLAPSEGRFLMRKVLSTICRNSQDAEQLSTS